MPNRCGRGQQSGQQIRTVPNSGRSPVLRPFPGGHAARNLAGETCSPRWRSYPALLGVRPADPPAADREPT